MSSTVTGDTTCNDELASASTCTRSEEDNLINMQENTCVDEIFLQEEDAWHADLAVAQLVTNELHKWQSKWKS